MNCQRNEDVQSVLRRIRIPQLFSGEAVLADYVAEQTEDVRYRLNTVIEVLLAVADAYKAQRETDVKTIADQTQRADDWKKTVDRLLVQVRNLEARLVPHCGQRPPGEDRIDELVVIADFLRYERNEARRQITTLEKKLADARVVQPAKDWGEQ